ncbi:MAG: hypothetical protein IKQ55_01070 [Kiritimatiellae bacterium]|nr:hypothetical protein [Kiritimatiellia bacterium]
MNAAFLILFLLLISFFGFVVAKACTWFRVCFALLVFILSVWGAYAYGRACEKLLCFGTYVRDFARYTTVLSNLSREGRYKELAEFVVDFDSQWKTNLPSPSNIDALITELERIKGTDPLKESSFP